MHIPKYILVIVLLALVVFVVLKVARSRQSAGLLVDASNVDDFDLRGIYTYPGVGALFVPKNPDGSQVCAPLTLVIFFSAKTACPASLSEVDTYRRLLPVFRDRGQAILAVTTRADSAVVASLLEREKLDISISVSDSADYKNGLTFDRMGISPLFMPFKVVYDSTLTAVFMRGANNTPESQAEFEAAMLRLSDWASD
ncbi:unnamed protein product [marine sediment metagenome]|uniref:Thioredoxin domain-containing protein n=1 Tax=marine sediment metagenome TaxID=412755 RepID=X1LGC5_9ZZZZ